MPKVSIIVPNYNHAKYLPVRLDSIFNQTFQDFELILLDDCSTDNSVEVLTTYSKHLKVSHFIVNKQNSGSTFKQWKKGLEFAKGEYIWIAESDDWADTSFLENLIKYLKQNEPVFLCYCKSYNANHAGQIENLNQFGEKIDPDKWNENFIQNGKLFIKKYLIHRNVIPNTSAVLFRKDIALKVIDNIINHKYAGDWLFWAYIIDGGNVGFISKPLNYFRRYEQSTFLSLNRQKFLAQVNEFLFVIDKIRFELLKGSKIAKLDHNWIIDFWIRKKHYLKGFEYLNPPFYFNLKLSFYKKILVNKILKSYFIRIPKYIFSKIYKFIFKKA